MSVVVEARFVGGTILVGTGDVADTSVVTVNMPSNTGAMLPDEARRLAVTLIEQAARAEAPPEGNSWP